MGVGGRFWDLLKPYARHEGFGYLRKKRVAVDLSFWIVQHETAIKKRSFARNPHLRLTFFRTINLFSKVCVVVVSAVVVNSSPRIVILLILASKLIPRCRIQSESSSPLHP